ncbi:Rho GTPase-activating Rho GTPase activation protein [Tubulinosema ratisbonensis]|uniref:Rho GTPase-activating Rho GTPase activation protein n=1 Tax=Tubulinosema ratisbonensis TaxID=291195 RepID=A0A437AIW8_9MICR|nr:Rho GTPase-activating Rho GTPase activation protein [Tubulinosema ratisbonensis]
MTNCTPKTKTLRVINYKKLFQEEKDALKRHCLRMYNSDCTLDFLASSFKRMFVSSAKKKKISSFVYEVIDYLKKNALNTLGIFRLPSNYNLTKKLTNHIINNERVPLEEYDHFTIVNSLKNYIREELDGLIPESVAISLEKNFKKETSFKNLEYFPFTLDEDRKDLLVALFSLFKEVDSHSNVNLMNIDNILLIVPPTIFPRVVQKNIKEFMPFVKFMKTVYELDYENVPVSFLKKEVNNKKYKINVKKNNKKYKIILKY